MVNEITVQINNKKIKVRKGVLLYKLIEEHFKNPYQYILAIVNGVLKELNCLVNEDSKITLLDLTNTDSQRTYKRSLSYIFIKAVKDTIKDAEVELCHTLSKGQYCEIKSIDITNDLLYQIRRKMDELVVMDIPFIRNIYHKDEAIEIFKENNAIDKVKLLTTIDKDLIPIYDLEGYEDYFYGYLVPSTGYVKLFDVIKEGQGILLICPDKLNPNKLIEYKPQPKLLKVFNESKEWAKIIDIPLICDLNKTILSNNYSELIQIVEALHENKIAKIAGKIIEENKRVILIAGPSASGKTSFSKRLNLQLKVNGFNPITISLDDYFVDRERTPLDMEGNYDFESINALDLKLLNDNLNKLLKGEKVEIPYYNFKTGKREFRGKVLKLEKNQQIIIEGIHGLNPLLTEKINDKLKHKIYVSALTQVNLDIHNRISTTDTRLIRRIVRDNQFRGYNAKKTISMWNSVQRGEENNIFPYQETADSMFNSAMIYELAILRKYAVPLLEEIKVGDEGYIEANRILKFLKYITPINEEVDIPPTSILREFIGGSRIVD